MSNNLIPTSKFHKLPELVNTGDVGNGSGVRRWKAQGCEVGAPRCLGLQDAIPGTGGYLSLNRRIWSSEQLLRT